MGPGTDQSVDDDNVDDNDDDDDGDDVDNMKINQWGVGDAPLHISLQIIEFLTTKIKIYLM